MANATDARISVALPGHPKTKKLARRLGDAGPLHCIYLFLWTAANRSDGDLSGMTDEDIELAINWNGEPDAFVAAMAAVGFLDGEESNRRIHDWGEHNGWAAGAKQRSDKSRWAALCKQYGRAEAGRMMPEYAAALSLAPEDDANGKAGRPSGTTSAVPKSATGTSESDSGTAPSPILTVTDTVSVTDTLPSQEDEPTVVGLSAAGGDAAADDRGTDGGNESQDLLGKVPKKNGPPPCPHLKIIDLYHEILPELTEVRVWEGGRESKLAARWKGDKERQNLEWWRDFFASVRGMPWLMGERVGQDGRPFKCTLEWLVSPTNFAKVIEGNYLDVRR